MFTTVNKKGGENKEMANKTIYIKDLDAFIERIVTSGLSYRKLAKEAGTSQTTISLIARGERNPSPQTAINICKALGCQFEDIFFIQNVYKSQQNKQ